MSKKISSAIEKIMLNSATFRGVEIIPTFINFFYGNNGTGKSTIAQAIGKDCGLTWQHGKISTDYNILVYNQEFITQNFQGYGNLKGVFTIGKQNIKIQDEIKENTEKKEELDNEILNNLTKKDKMETAKNTLLSAFKENCWIKTKYIRDEFDMTQIGQKTKARFAEKVLSTSSSFQHDIISLKVLYDTAFDENAQRYEEFLENDIHKLKDSQGYELLNKSITSSSDTAFSNFIKAINATDWVRKGYEQYYKTDNNKCPYCQQKLPDDFENQISACFDAN